MNKYTVKPPNGITSVGSKYGVIQDVMDTPSELFNLLDKLGAYEDTGLDPEGVKTLKNNFEALSRSHNEMMDRTDDWDSKGRTSDIHTIEHCPFCGKGKEYLEYDTEDCIVKCNECGRNFRVQEDLY